MSLRKVLHSCKDQRDKDKNEVFLRVLSRCSACPQQGSCPRPGQPVPGWPCLLPATGGFLTPRFCQGLLFPSLWGSSASYHPGRGTRDAADGSLKQMISIAEVWGTLAVRKHTSAPRILDSNHNERCSAWYFIDSRITCKPVPPTKRLIFGLDFH